MKIRVFPYYFDRVYPLSKKAEADIKKLEEFKEECRKDRGK